MIHQDWYILGSGAFFGMMVAYGLAFAVPVLERIRLYGKKG